MIQTADGHAVYVGMTVYSVGYNKDWQPFICWNIIDSIEGSKGIYRDVDPCGYIGCRLASAYATPGGARRHIEQELPISARRER